MRPAIVATLAAALLTIAPSVQAQYASWALPEAGGPARFTLGVAGLGAAPHGAFRDNIGGGLQGGGFSGFGLLRLDRAGVLSLRLDGGGVWYGRESQRIHIVSPRIGADVVTTNAIAQIAIGPELAVPAGPVRPYVNATVGYNVFSTSSALEGVDQTNDDSQSFTTRQQSDVIGAYAFGGGVRVPVGPRRWDFSLDLGTRVYRGGQTSYLKAGDIVDNPDGTLTLNTRRSRTDFQTFYLGVAFGLHPSMGRGYR